VVAVGAAALFAVSAGVAQAEPSALVSYGTFHLESSKGAPWGSAAVAVDDSCLLHSPPLSGEECAAFDSSAGTVYVGTSINHNFEFGRVYKFGAFGEPLSPQSFGGGLDTSVAVNPANGDVYVLEGPNFGTFETEIVIYEPDGEPVSRFNKVAPSNNFRGFGTRVQIAVDAAGDVYVPVVPGNEVIEYSPTGTVLNTFTGGTGAGALKAPNAVVLDRSRDLWVADAGNNRIEELDSSGAPIEVNNKRVEIASEGIESVALDGRGDVFAITQNREGCGSIEPPCPHLIEYGSTGATIADVGAGSFGQKIGSAVGAVAVDQASGRVYVTDPVKELVWIFGPPAAPVVGKELVAEVGTSEAKLGALVSPGALPTSYRFEYGTTGAYGGSTAEGSVGAGVMPRTVWAGIGDLAPGTTYHYRVVATNALGAVTGPDETFTTPTAAEVACPNEALRGGFAAKLPDCRAYELVIPPAKNSSQPREDATLGVLPGGDAVSFETVGEPLPGAPSGGSQYLVTREARDWRAEDLLPVESSTGVLCNSPLENSSVYATSEAMSEKLSRSVVGLGAKTSAATQVEGFVNESCNSEGREVVLGEPIGFENLLMRDNGENVGNRYRLINAPPPGVTPASAHFKGASPDLSHVFFTEESTLGVSGASYGVENLFEWDEGTLRLLTVSESGLPIAGSLADGAHPISANGSHVLFTSGGGLYDRIDGQRTVQVDRGAGSSGGGVFVEASPDGSHVFFLDGSNLTPNSTAETGEPDLYECTLPEGASECDLSDLTVAKAGEHADVKQVALGSQDSSHVYFTATGVLASNKREYEYTDVEGNRHKVVEEAGHGQENLYVDEGGKVTFVATFIPESKFGGQAASPDGRWFAFTTLKSLTGYDNRTGEGALPEVFLYSAVSRELVCASCNPSGEAPIAGLVPTELPSADRGPVSDAGQVFFQTPQALVPLDSNGQVDVYEYEHDQSLLISSGTSPQESKLDGVSESGRDVVFESTQALVPQDAREGVHVAYDARVGGGFPFAVSPPACTTPEGCRGAVSPQSSLYGAPASQTFSGVGNLEPPAKTTLKSKAKPKRKSGCKRGFVKRKHRCVKRGARKKARKSTAIRGRR